MTYFMKSGTTFRVTTPESLDLHEELPVGTYAVEQNPITGEFYLDRIKDLEVKGKIYGDAERLTERILSTFLQRPNSTGVLLSGEKGSGKTLQAKLLSRDARERLRVPTLVVNRPYRGDGFNQFMQMIDQPVVVLFDEFEKVYAREEQEAMLTLLDGVYPSKKLFVLTCNDKYRINEQMKNRPGRLYYRVQYTGLEDAFIREYAEDTLKDASQKNIDDIVTISSVFASFNFDMLQALVEEMNRYGEDAKTANKYLNARPDDDDLDVTYNAELFVNGEPVEPERLQTPTWTGNPIENDLYMVMTYVDKDADPDDRQARRQVVFNESDLVEVTVDRDRGPVFRFEGSAHKREDLAALIGNGNPAKDRKIIKEDVTVLLSRRKTPPAYSVLF